MRLSSYDAALAAIKLLEQSGFQARLAGGCVRDRLRGVAPKDHDIATDAQPEQVIALFKQAGYRTVPTGIKHGTITLVYDGIGIEITTLRADVHTDGRHAVVEFSKDFALDAARRDFTVNAMYEDRHGKVYDYFAGQSDLQARKLVFVGDADQRIQEDYLRIMRMFRFWAQLQFTPTPAALAATTRHSDGLALISQERITAELMALLREAKIALIVEQMFAVGVMAQILPAIKFKRTMLAAIVATAKVEKEYRSLARLGILLDAVEDSEALQALIAGLRMSNNNQAQLLVLIKMADKLAEVSSRAAAMQLIDAIERRTFIGSFLRMYYPIWSVRYGGKLRGLEFMYQTELEDGDLRRSGLPITGDDLLAYFGKPAGVWVGKLLAKLRWEYREKKWRTKDEGLALAKRLI
ncbi:MAG: CCA tRNA nucleotidyltransferase [Pseudomonadota bacterium]|nr:CCA tRNA nucleotidyltransferase [Pseudomonadota bacterium]